MAQKKYKSVDDFLNGQTLWQPELSRLRDVLASTGLDESLKWSMPCYSHNGKNVAGICGFKGYFGVWFHQGALLTDPHNVLINAQEGKTKALRQWRMTSKSDIKVRILKSYVTEAKLLVEAGKQIKPSRQTKKSVSIPKLLADRLGMNKRAKSRFEKLTPAKQREYCEYIAAAKRDDTKLRRLEKIIPMIAAGNALSDLYRK